MPRCNLICCATAIGSQSQLVCITLHDDLCAYTHLYENKKLVSEWYKKLCTELCVCTIPHGDDEHLLLYDVRLACMTIGMYDDAFV